MDTSFAISGLGRLTSGLNMGVVLLDSSANLKFADGTARSLLGCMSQAELNQRWHDLMPGLNLSPGHLPKGARALRFKADLSLDEGERKLELEMCGLGQDEREGCLLLLRDRENMDNLEC